MIQNFKLIKTIYFILIFIVFAVLVHLVGFSLYNYWKEFVPPNKEDSYDGISVTIAYAGGFLNIITIGFLLINYAQQRNQIKTNYQNTELNRVVDIIYRQLELTIPQIKNKLYLHLYKLFSDFEMNNGERLNSVDEDIEVFHSLLNTASHIENFLFIINNSSLDVKEREYLRTIVFNNLNKDFFDVMDSFYNLTEKKRTMFNLTDTIDRILKIKQPITN